MTWLSLRADAAIPGVLRLLPGWFLMVSLAASAAAPSEDFLSAFNAANKLYEQSKFTEAATAYEELARAGHTSASLCYNLGNAFFKSSQLGRAIAAYRQAAHMTPRDPDVLANLQFARNQVQAPTLSVPRWHRWVSRLSLDEWTLGMCSALWMLLLLLIVAQVRPVWRQSLRGWIIFTCTTTVLLGVCLIAAVNLARYTETAIVITPDAQVRQGPLDESPTAFVVHDGAELRILDRKEDWLQVTTDARRVGWIRKDPVLILPGM